MKLKMGGELKSDRVCIVTDKNGKITMPPMMAWLSMPPRISLFNFNKQFSFYPEKNKKIY